MAVTRTDYKISRERVAGDTVTVLVRFYAGEYVATRPEPVATEWPEEEYQRTGGVVHERLYTFSASGYTASRLRGFLNDRLHSLNSLANVAAQARRTAPVIAPTSEAAP